MSSGMYPMQQAAPPFAGPEPPDAQPVSYEEAWETILNTMRSRPLTPPELMTTQAAMNAVGEQLQAQLAAAQGVQQGPPQAGGPESETPENQQPGESDMGTGAGGQDMNNDYAG